MCVPCVCASVSKQKLDGNHIPVHNSILLYITTCTSSSPKTLMLVDGYNFGAFNAVMGNLYNKYNKYMYIHLNTMQQSCMITTHILSR